ncbi:MULTISPECIES: flagellar hook-length control protein FliK [unclassified Marinobacter]|uniref:flagellar hook-length control protein FliK n=1 Tax=unclassified Marinobacter TaxID=83889 RepID=UPI0026E494E3|nr:MULTISPECIES: flagellar hook-length control protein FliK [unclassified Marinobacter]MDO6440813.1 flagellar hook-length control protein FliK [Marinobacter sp. 2_MG-2023]MDO6823641.1 flagellar hook-length control protein FliK [Marinobacter sp. 1_MG-2023]
MTQMVLPQTPAPGAQKDAGAPKPDSARDSGADESRYEAVSRAEQKRLDKRQADARNSERQENSQSATRADSASKTAEAGKPDKPALAGKDKAADKPGAGKNAEPATEMEAVTTPLTFAELQALLLPAASQVGVAGSAGGTATSSPATELFAGLTGGKPGQTGQLMNVGNGGAVAGLQLTDALMPGSGESARVADTSSLFTGTRLEAAMELVSQQSTHSSAGKLAAEAQVPLRSYATSVDVPVNHAEWGDKLMGKLSWLTAKNLSVAEIHLTPPDMGPMEVRVRVQNEQANITVHAANPVVRDQLELHSQRLRDMLGEQGLSLAQFDVSDNSQNQRGEQGSGDGESASSGSGAEFASAGGSDMDNQSGSLDLSWNGAVDIFA